jgi:hypothetical protein
MLLVRAFFAVMGLLLTINDAAAQGSWLRAESAHFIVYRRGGEGDLYASVEELERFDATLRQLVQNNAPPAENKLEIYLLRDRSELAQVWPAASREVAGFYQATPEQIAAFSLDRNEGLDARTVLFHEYAHHFMFQYFPDAYPAWFTEGFAEYVSTAELSRRRSRLGGYDENRTRPLFGLNWASMADILDPTREGARRVPSYMFYSQSWINVHYILSSPERKRALSSYFAAVESGSDRIAAFEDAFDTTLADWERSLRAYLGRGIALHDLPVADADASMRITRLPASADDLLLLMARARRVVEDEDRPELANRLIAAASRHPGDAYAQLALARAELVRNQPAAARPILEALVALNSNDAEAHYLLGLTFLRESESESLDAETRRELVGRARPHFVRAFRISPNHVPTLYHYVRTFPQPLQDSTLEVLLRAHELAPQVDEIGFATAVALMLADAHQQAVPILRSIAYNRHGGRLRRHALVTLAAALAGENPPPPPPDEAEQED